MINFNSKKAEEKCINYAKALSASNSPVTQQVIENEVLTWLADIYPFINIDVRLTICESGPYVNVDVLDPKAYEWLMNQPSTSISIYVIQSWRHKEIQLVTHDCKLSLIFDIKCPLPDDDLATLDMLGKVHHEVIPSSIHKSVYCEI